MFDSVPLDISNPRYVRSLTLVMWKVGNPSDQVAASRDLAKRARLLAQGLTQEADRMRLLRYAEELELRCAEAEAEARVT
jgi:hypothetical protein